MATAYSSDRYNQLLSQNPFAIDYSGTGFKSYDTAYEMRADLQKQEAIAKIERDQAAARKRNEQLQSIAQGQLGRAGGSEFLTYAGDRLDAALESGLTEEEAIQQVTQEVSGTSEARNYARNAPAYWTDPENIYTPGTRPDDWATQLDTNFLDARLDNMNQLYGQELGTFTGQAGSEWWGWQERNDIAYHMSEAGGNKNFQEAEALARDTALKNINATYGGTAFDMYGSSGYGTAIDINYNTDPTTGLQIIQPAFLNIDEGALGTTTGHQGEEFTRVADSTAIGGYREIANTPAAEYIAENSFDQLGRNPFNPYGTGGDLPEGFINVDASRFGLGPGDNDKLTQSQWVENPANAAAVAANDFSSLNIGFSADPLTNELIKNPDVNANPNYNPDLPSGPGNFAIFNSYLQHTVGPGQTSPFGHGGIPAKHYNQFMIDQGRPEVTADTFQPVQYVGPGGSGGNKVILAQPPQRSKTAKQQQVVEKVRPVAQGTGAKTYQKSIPQSSVSQLGIVTGDKKRKSS